VQIFRHIAQKSLAIRQYACGISRQSAEKSDNAPYAQALCGVALATFSIIQHFSQIEKYQKQNFDRYVAFLKKNDIPNIFMDGEDPQETAFDRKIKQTDLLEGIVPVSQCSLEEIAERNRDYYTNLDEKLDRLSKKLNFTSDLLQKERIKNQKIATEPLSKKVVNKVKGFLK